MRALVTGAGGFAGQWLCAELLSDGWDVHGATLTGAPGSGTLEDWQRDAVYWHDVDLRDQAEVGTVLDAARPDAVFHLAGVSYLPDAGADRVRRGRRTCWPRCFCSTGSPRESRRA